MPFTIWYLVAGLLFVGMALGGSVLKRLPLTTSLLYLAVGFAVGPHGLGLLDIHPLTESAFLERLTEVAVIVSLFTAGLKLRVDWRDRRWWLPVRLAFGSMAATVGLIAVAGVYGLGLSLGAAVLLGAILAPTDPVLASDVQVAEPRDQDRLRFALTGEAGLNDGTAFPFVMLGLGLLGVHELGAFGWRWVAVDVVWAVAAGLAVGALLGTAVGRLVVYLRREHKTAHGLDDFLALGLIALAYGVALTLHTYGFLAVFAAGLALRRVEHQLTDDDFDAVSRQIATGEDEEDVATRPDTAPAHMTESVLGFNEQLERIGEVIVVVLVGTLLSTRDLPLAVLWFVPLLLLVIRPVAAMIGLVRTRTFSTQRRLIAWFGIRGIGSIYYLMFAIEHGIPEDLARRLTALTLAVVAVSVVVHGVSVTPLMGRYQGRVDRGSSEPSIASPPATATDSARSRGVPGATGT